MSVTTTGGKYVKMETALFLNGYSRACVPGLAGVIMAVDMGNSMPQTVQKIVGIKRNVFILEKDALRIKSSESLSDDPGNDPFVWGLGFKMTVEKIDLTASNRARIVEWIKSLDRKLVYKGADGNRLIFTYAQMVPDIVGAYDTKFWWVLYSNAVKVDVSKYNLSGHGSRLEQVKEEREQKEDEKAVEREERAETLKEVVSSITGSSGGAVSGLNRVADTVNGAVGGTVIKAIFVYLVIQIIQGKKIFPNMKRRGRR